MGMICEICGKSITEATPWSILDGKRQHILKGDCKVTRNTEGTAPDKKKAKIFKQTLSHLREGPGFTTRTLPTPRMI